MKENRGVLLQEDRCQRTTMAIALRARDVRDDDDSMMRVEENTCSVIRFLR